MDLLRQLRRRGFAKIKLGGNNVSIPTRYLYLQHCTASPSPQTQSIEDARSNEEGLEKV